MNQIKNSKSFFKRFRKSKVLLVFLLLIVTVGGTIAYLTDMSDTVINRFKPSHVTTKVEETLNENTKEDVYITNTGDTDVWIRAAVTITWQDENGNVYGELPVEGADYTIAWGQDWLVGEDGFYYWPVPVAENNGKTGILIDSCTTDKAMTVGEKTYYLSVMIVGSGIQSSPSSVFSDQWQESSGLSLNSDGTELLKTN